MNEKPKTVNSKKVELEITQQEINQLLLKPDSEFIQDILEYNQISFLVLSGVLTISQSNELLGYFKDVVDTNGKKIKYPNGQYIDDVFIYNPSQLKKGVRYYFAYELASIKERRKRNNYYLLQTTVDKVEQGESVNSILKAIEEKNEQLNKLIEEKNSELNKLDETIQGYEQTISEKVAKIAKTGEELSQLDAKIKSDTIKFDQLANQIRDMENTIETLRPRISLCRNLDFLTAQEETQYFDRLNGENLVSLDNHLSFENELESNFAKLADHIHHYLFYHKNLIYTKFQIRNFLTLLRTHDLIVLCGLSGSGKTQIVKAFAEALGGVAKIIPVKPNWTSSDDLIGYYNPIQMSFLPTPFTEAIVEAIQNPNRLYFICLDEMNLARVEYYFADFLSKLEERSSEPEIELYAKHEEELFVSEFNTLLNIIESSIEGMEIKSWQDFINKKEARTRFFEMLGNADKESLLQLHAKMKRRLIDILKFPATIKIPNNVRFIGAINVDETTYYFSPKILDRVHIVKFENPLIYEQEVTNFFENMKYDKELKPIYVDPDVFSQRSEYPKMNETKYVVFRKIERQIKPYADVIYKLKEINQRFLVPLNIDFGVRSIRQSLNYVKLNREVNADDYNSLNTIIIQKILPRFLFDSSEISKNGSTKLKVLEDMLSYLNKLFYDYCYSEPQGSYMSEIDYEEVFREKLYIRAGRTADNVLSEMIKQAETNPQINFFA